MTTNGEWLDYLAHNAPDELSAWFDAEHVENQERALDGNIAALNPKSAELENQILIGLQCERELRAKVDRLTAERERYREKFGKCLDYADAIHALMDDEGMA